MNVKERLSWFKRNFGMRVEAATAGTPISVDLVAAIACQETGYIWPALIKHHGGNVDAVLRDCVGDTLDYPKRNANAFPRDKDDLLTRPYGADLFDIAREALARIGKVFSAYQDVYDAYPDKFCHGFGILQFDIQHVERDLDFFLERRWADFDTCLAKCLEELDYALDYRGFQTRDNLSDFEAATVAIVYNTGKYVPSRGLKQGHKSGGKYYGEWVKEFIGISKQVETEFLPDMSVDDIVPETYVVTARGGLNLRAGPGTDYSINDTVPEGTEVNVVAFMGSASQWALVDLQDDGGRDGFMYAEFLAQASSSDVNPDAVEDALRMDNLLASDSGSAEPVEYAD